MQFRFSAGRRAAVAAVLLGLSWGSASEARAQEPVPTPTPSPVTTQLTGQVEDASGAVVPNATVTLRNLTTGVERRTVTDSQGRFVVSGLAVGEYQVKVDAAGFRTEVVDRVQVKPGALQTLMIRLGGGPVPVPSPGPVPPPVPVPSPLPPEAPDFAVFDWKASAEEELRQLLESVTAMGWGLVSVIPVGNQRGFFYFEKASGASYEIVKQSEPATVEQLRRQIAQRPGMRLAGMHRLNATEVLWIFRSKE